MTLQELHDLTGKLLKRCPLASDAHVVTASERQLENGEQNSIDAVYLRQDTRIYAVSESPVHYKLILEQ